MFDRHEKFIGCWQQGSAGQQTAFGLHKGDLSNVWIV
jgi:hypothetical protein